ncbi:MAG: hypothetical protein H0S79_25930 [Anaerolineaceae bacterium]|nr:hypothetical protein [Anaerolineaceae bacterium]
MERKVLDKVCQQVYRRYPNLKGKSPKVTSQGSERYLLLFTGSGETPDGKIIKQTVRVVTDDSGRILKTSTSR